MWAQSCQWSSEIHWNFATARGRPACAGFYVQFGEREMDIDLLGSHDINLIAGANSGFEASSIANSRVPVELDTITE